MMRRSLVVLNLALALACASPQPSDAPAMPRAQYKGEVGDSPVGAIPDAVLHDAQRQKDVAITIEYPTRSATNPLIVFSPGYGGSNDSYVGLSSYWASQGYVVVRVAHADAGRQLAANEDFWTTMTEADRRNRVRDITFVLDSLDQLEQSYPELKGKIDRAKITAAGHSYGAYVAMLLGGAKIYPGGTSYADSRVKAVIAMSPQGPSEVRGLTSESWADVRVPTLYMTGTADFGVAETETPDWRRQAFELSAPGDKWLIVVEHATQATFVGRYDPFLEAQARERATEMEYPRDRTGTVDTPMPRRVTSSNAAGAAMRHRELLYTIKSLSLAFLDAYQKGDEKAKEALEKAKTSGGVEVKTK